METNTGLTAHLQLAGPGCNAFGRDINVLTIEITYETNSRQVASLNLFMRQLLRCILRLHVNIYDTENRQYTIPESIVSRPAPPTQSFKHSSDLVFNYEPSPFAFWITRRSRPRDAPLFDTRSSSLPPLTTVLLLPNDSSTTLDGFPLVFEDQYLQVCITHV